LFFCHHLANVSPPGTSSSGRSLPPLPSSEPPIRPPLLLVCSPFSITINPERASCHPLSLLPLHSIHDPSHNHFTIMPAYRTRDTSSHSLEVSTITLPQAPTVTIISPTPRAFTFPFHNNDHYVSPSNSPFEPDLKPLSFTPPLPRTLSPTSSIASDSSTISSPSSAVHLAPPQPLPAPPQQIAVPVAHRRRKSFGGDPIERRPKKGDEDYIKRPENAFILFRRKCCEERHAPDGAVAGGASDEGLLAAPTKKQRQADLSKTISQQWKGLSQEERQHWENLAKEKKKEHEQMYPNYVYRPQRTKTTKGKKGKGRRGFAGESEQDTDAESFSCTLPVNLAPSGSRQHHGRARSAPTPPLTYQTIHIPTVYMPSCPSSPSLYPVLPRRTPLPRLSLDQDLPASMTYQSDDSFMLPPAFSHPHDFEANLENSEMFQGMFDLPGQSTPLNKNSSLTSNSIPQDESTMISPSHMISPASSYSGSPSTPHHSPFTPLTGFPLSRPSVVDGQEMPIGYVSEGQHCVDVEGHGADMSYMEYPAGYGWENAGMWPTATGELVHQDEYDINAIPPVELSIPDYSGEEIHHVGTTSTLAMAVGPPSGEFCAPRNNEGNENDLFTGMFSFSEPMMW